MNFHLEYLYTYLILLDNIFSGGDSAVSSLQCRQSDPFGALRRGIFVHPGPSLGNAVMQCCSVRFDGQDYTHGQRSSR